jgi:hypothetical protein
MADEIAQAVLLKLAPVLSDLASALEKVEKLKQPEDEWVTSREFRQMVGLTSPAALHYHIRKGVFRPNAIRNIGAGSRSTYRFHRSHAVTQFLNRR